MEVPKRERPGKRHGLPDQLVAHLVPLFPFRPFQRPATPLGTQPVGIEVCIRHQGQPVEIQDRPHVDTIRQDLWRLLTVEFGENASRCDIGGVFVDMARLDLAGDFQVLAKVLDQGEAMRTVMRNDVRRPEAAMAEIVCDQDEGIDPRGGKTGRGVPAHRDTRGIVCIRRARAVFHIRCIHEHGPRAVRPDETDIAPGGRILAQGELVGILPARTGQKGINFCGAACFVKTHEDVSASLRRAVPVSRAALPQGFRWSHPAAIPEDSPPPCPATRSGQSRPGSRPIRVRSPPQAISGGKGRSARSAVVRYRTAERGYKSGLVRP